MRTPIDFAAALTAWLVEQKCSACTTPVPDDLEAALPITVITTLGGQRISLVQDSHRVQVDTYGETMADALDESRAIFARIDSINDTHPTIGGVQTYESEMGALPAESDDPNHPDVSVASFIAQVTCRTQES